MKLIASVTLKIVGIYCIIQSIRYVQPIINAFCLPYDDSSMRNTLIIGAIVTFLLFLGIGIYLIAFSNNIAENMVPAENPVEGSKGIEPRDLQALAFSVVGIVLIALSISKLFQLGVNIYALQSPNLEDSIRAKISRETIAVAIGLTTQLIIGMLLFVCGGSVSNLWHAIKRRFQHELNIT